MQSSTGQYSTHAGEPAHPVQHSVITANSFGFFLRGVARPFDFGSNLSSSGTIPTALVAPGAGGMAEIIPRSPPGPKRYSASTLCPSPRSPPISFCYSEPQTKEHRYGWKESEPRSVDWQFGQRSRSQIHAAG